MQHRHGRRWFYSCEFFAKQKYSKLKNVHGCTFLSGSRPTSQAEAKIVVPVVRTVVVPFAYSAVVRVVVPAAAAFNTVRA